MKWIEYTVFNCNTNILVKEVREVVRKFLVVS